MKVIKISQDKWFGTDKIMHLFVCLIISYVWGWQTAALTGFFKEVIDTTSTGFSYKDLIWDGIGIVLGCSLRLLL